MATEFSLSGSIRFVPKLLDTLAATAVTDTATASIALGLSDGTGDNAANAYWRDVVTIAAGASATLDLQALPLVAFGGTGSLNLATAKAILIVNQSRSRGVTVNGSGSNLWTAFTAGATAIGSQAVLLAVAPMDGWAVGSAAKNLVIANAAQAASATGSITSGSAALTALASTASLRVGQSVSGTGIPTGATITAIGSASSVTISAAATATATGVTLTFQNPAAAIEIYIVGVKV